MTTQTAAILLAAAISFLIPLAGYALHLHLEAKRQLALAEEKRSQENRQARINLFENLAIMAQAVEQDQVNLTEACLRIRVLLDLLEEGRYVQREDLQVFDEVHQKAKHLATHQAREDLPPQEREQQDKQRRALEEQYEARIRQGAQALAALCESEGGVTPPAPFVNAAQQSPSA
ncbi:DUF2489 domain-containing protein [Marinospirillum sp.]|uniref:DUF2489 domain-containing protein n=1 Tax=Marinospirillum sp. TaxID=2183934 RepID=UPI003A8BF8AC